MRSDLRLQHHGRTCQRGAQGGKPKGEERECVSEKIGELSETEKKARVEKMRHR